MAGALGGSPIGLNDPFGSVHPAAPRRRSSAHACVRSRARVGAVRPGGQTTRSLRTSFAAEDLGSGAERERRLQLQWRPGVPDELPRSFQRHRGAGPAGRTSTRTTHIHAIAPRVSPILRREVPGRSELRAHVCGRVPVVGGERDGLAFQKIEVSRPLSLHVEQTRHRRLARRTRGARRSWCRWKEPGDLLPPQHGHLVPDDGEPANFAGASAPYTDGNRCLRRCGCRAPPVRRRHRWLHDARPGADRPGHARVVCATVLNPSEPS